MNSNNTRLTFCPNTQKDTYCRAEHEQSDTLRRGSRAGFTLAELLIVVAIIAVLVAIAIPIFSNQLEKARDAQSVDAIRKAYSTAMMKAMEHDGKQISGTSFKDGNCTVYMSNGTVSAVIVEKVKLKSGKQNNWSGQAEKLPFYDVMTNHNSDLGKKSSSDSNHGDIGKAPNTGKTTYIEFYFWEGGKLGYTQPKTVYIWRA